MSDPRTLRIPEDETRTLVDTRFRGTRARRPRRTPVPILGLLAKISAWRVPLSFAFVLLVAGVLGTMAHRERRAADRLRQAVRGWETNRAHPQKCTPETATRAKPIVRIEELAAIESVDARARDRAERDAAQLLLANHYAQALAHYRLLATRFPGERVYADFVAVLESKLRCSSGEGRQCD